MCELWILKKKKINRFFQIPNKKSTQTTIHSIRSSTLFIILRRQRAQNPVLVNVRCMAIEKRTTASSLVPVRTACSASAGHPAVPYLTYSTSKTIRRQCRLRSSSWTSVAAVVRCSTSATARFLSAVKLPSVSRAAAGRRPSTVSSVRRDISSAVATSPAAPAHTTHTHARVFAFTVYATRGALRPQRVHVPTGIRCFSL